MLERSMSELTSNKKARLGRGIGSLLGGGMSDLNESAPANQSPAPIAGEEPQGKPATTNQSVAQAAPLDETQKIWSVGIERIVPNIRQPRKVFNPEELKEL